MAASARQSELSQNAMKAKSGVVTHEHAAEVVVAEGNEKGVVTHDAAEVVVTEGNESDVVSEVVTESAADKVSEKAMITVRLLEAWEPPALRSMMYS